MLIPLLFSLFIFDPSIHDAFETPQAVYLSIISCGLIVYLLIVYLIDKKEIHLPHWPVFGAWLGMDLFSLVAAVNPYQALSQIWIDQLGIVAFYFTINYLVDPDRVRGLIRIIIALASVIALWALASLYFSIDPPMGNLQLAGMAIAPACFLVFGSLRFGHAAVLSALLWVVLIATGCKTGMISVIGSGALVLWLGGDRVRWMGYITAMVIIVIFYVAGPVRPEPSHIARVYWTANTARMITDHPVIGVGRGNWPLVYPAYAATWGDPVMDTQYIDLGSGKGVSKNLINAAHNDYLQMLAEIGPVGLVAFLAAIWAVSRRRRSRDIEGYGLYGAIWTILIYAVMSFPFSVAPVTALFWVLMGCLWLQRHGTTPGRNPVRISRRAELRESKVILDF